MKAFFSNLTVLLFLTVFLGMLEGYQDSLSPLPQEYVPSQAAKHFKIKENNKSIPDNAKLKQADDYYNLVDIIGTDYTVYEYEINETIKRWKNNTSDSILSWSYNNYHIYAVTAMGLDNKHHFANHYLIGYEPFKTDKIWEPLLTLAMHKKYQLDHIHYAGKKEVWQNSYEAFQFTRGDCEDHAIALADWLIAMGEDARVVAGDYKGGGHAWVVLLKEGKTYLLEATDKSRIKRAHRFPLAKLLTNYHPEFMFNREYFWINTGTKYTTNYQSDKWEKRSFFSRVKKI